jgi:hypothetical protein
MAILTLQHWNDTPTGLSELRRVARDRVVILTWHPAHPGFWMTDRYFPEAFELDRARFPTLVELARELGSAARPPHPHSGRLYRRLLRSLLAAAGGVPRPGRSRRHLDVQPARPGDRRARTSPAA